MEAGTRFWVCDVAEPAVVVAQTSVLPFLFMERHVELATPQGPACRDQRLRPHASSEGEAEAEAEAEAETVGLRACRGCLQTRFGFCVALCRRWATRPSGSRRVGAEACLAAAAGRDAVRSPAALCARWAGAHTRTILAEAREESKDRHAVRQREHAQPLRGRL